jgi:hypothetical protein
MAPVEKLYQKGHSLSFPCAECRHTVPLPVFELEARDCIAECSECLQKYSFADPALLRQLRKFEDLCRQIHLSEEILSQASLGVDVGPHQVKIPFKLLLTRLNANMELAIGSHRLTITFRLEPLQLPEAAAN